MHLLIRGTVLVTAIGLFFLAPPEGRTANYSIPLVAPSKFQVRVLKGGQRASLSLAGNRSGNRLVQTRHKMLLAKSPKAYRKKG